MSALQGYKIGPEGLEHHAAGARKRIKATLKSTNSPLVPKLILVDDKCAPLYFSDVCTIMCFADVL